MDWKPPTHFQLSSPPIAKVNSSMTLLSLTSSHSKTSTSPVTAYWASSVTIRKNSSTAFTSNYCTPPSFNIAVHPQDTSDRRLNHYPTTSARITAPHGIVFIYIERGERQGGLTACLFSNTVSSLYIYIYIYIHFYNKNKYKVYLFFIMLLLNSYRCHYELYQKYLATLFVLGDAFLNDCFHWRTLLWYNCPRAASCKFVSRYFTSLKLSSSEWDHFLYVGGV